MTTTTGIERVAGPRYAEGLCARVCACGLCCSVPLSATWGVCNGALAVTWQRLPSKGGHFTNQPTIPVEFFKYLQDDCTESVLDILNHCWEAEAMLKEMELAELVTLYEKGNVEDPANYRPIALLNTLYEIYASILQDRLASRIEDKIWETQSGFRKKKSTTQPLSVTRRLQDLVGIT